MSRLWSQTMVYNLPVLRIADHLSSLPDALDKKCFKMFISILWPSRLSEILSVLLCMVLGGWSESLGLPVYVAQPANQAESEGLEAITLFPILALLLFCVSPLNTRASLHLPLHKVETRTSPLWHEDVSICMSLARRSKRRAKYFVPYNSHISLSPLPLRGQIQHYHLPNYVFSIPCTTLAVLRCVFSTPVASFL